MILVFLSCCWKIKIQTGGLGEKWRVDLEMEDWSNMVLLLWLDDAVGSWSWKRVDGAGNGGLIKASVWVLACLPVFFLICCLSAEFWSGVLVYYLSYFHIDSCVRLFWLFGVWSVNYDLVYNKRLMDSFINQIYEWWYTILI